MSNTSSSASKSSKSFAFGRICRGATLVEYAFLLVAIMSMAGCSYKALGHKTATSVHRSSHAL